MVGRRGGGEVLKHVFSQGHGRQFSYICRHNIVAFHIQNISKIQNGTGDMRILTALILFIVAGWRGYLDYSGSTAQGQPYSMTSLDTVWSSISPASYNLLSSKLQALDVPMLWDPTLSTVMTAPATVVFLCLAVFFFLIRRREFEA